MGTLRIEVGDLHFSARWEAAAPQTIEAIRRMLPIESKVIHCRWSGESVWIPYGDFRPGHRLREPHLASGPRACSRCTRAASASARSSSRTAACTTSSKVGQLAANHFASIVPDEGWQDRLREMGRRTPVGRRPADPDRGGRLSQVESDFRPLFDTVFIIVITIVFARWWQRRQRARAARARTRHNGLTRPPRRARSRTPERPTEPDD